MSSINSPEKIEGSGFNRIARIYFVIPLVVAPICATCLVLVYFSSFWDNSIPTPLLMLAPHAMVFQLPFVVFASLKSFNFLRNPRVECQSPITRWGIALGVLTGLYFTVVVVIAEHELDGGYLWDGYERVVVHGLVTLAFVISTLPWLSVRFQDFLQRCLVFLLALMMSLHVLIWLRFGLETALFWPFLLVRFAGPWYFVAECCLTFSIWKYWVEGDWPDKERRLIDLFLPVGLISTFITCGFGSFKVAQFLKSTLPPPPECFIATAAAQGHPAIVRSWEITDVDGQTRRVNHQLLTLKEFEAFLIEDFPRFYRVLRAIYNYLGPVGAWLIQPPLLGDLAYLLLKPIEWTAQFILRSWADR